MQIFIGLVAIAMGVHWIWFRKEAAVYCMQSQNRLWGFRFGERGIRAAECVIVVVGFGWIALGTLIVLGVAQFRR